MVAFRGGQIHGGLGTLVPHLPRPRKIRLHSKVRSLADPNFHCLLGPNVGTPSSPIRLPFVHVVFGGRVLDGVVGVSNTKSKTRSVATVHVHREFFGGQHTHVAGHTKSKRHWLRLDHFLFALFVLVDHGDRHWFKIFLFSAYGRRHHQFAFVFY